MPKKIEINLLSDHVGNVSTASVYAGGKRIGFAILITDEISEHTQSQIWRGLGKLFKDREEGK